MTSDQWLRVKQLFDAAGDRRHPFRHGGRGRAQIGMAGERVPGMLLTDLAQTRGLEVASTRRLQEARRQRGGAILASLDRAAAADVARRAAAGAVVVGNIFQWVCF